MGYVCRAHFDEPIPRVVCPHREKGLCPACSQEWHRLLDERRDRQRACPDCQAVTQAEAERCQREDTIDPAQPYGAHISLTCRNHPDLRWHTKNIGWIGARSIFYSGAWGTECPCPISDLEVLS